MSLAKALLEVQKELPAIEPDAVNPHFKNKYVSLDRLLAVCLPILNKHGVVLVQLPSYIDTIDGKTTASLTTTLLHAETGEREEHTMPLILEKENSQGMGSAITYARRYMLAAALGVSGEKDDDGNAASQAKKPKAQSKPAVPRGEKMRVRIQELAQEADKLREADPGTTWAEVIGVIAWKSEPLDVALTWDSLSEEDLTWLGSEIKAYVDAGVTGMNFYEHVTLAF